MINNGAVFEDELHAELTASAVHRVHRMRFLGADHLHRTGFVEVKTPLGDVEVMRTPVAVVAGAVVVVETPEHRIEGIDAAGSALVGIGRPRRRAQPHIPVDILVRGGFDGDGLDLFRRAVPAAEEAVRMGGTAQIGGEIGNVGIVLRGSVAVVAVDVFDVADEAVADDHAGGAEFAPGTLHGTGLEHALEFLLRLHDQDGFLHGIGQRFFAIHVFAGFHGGTGHVGMPMVGHGNADRVDVFVLDDVAEIGHGFADGEFGLAVFLVIIIDGFGSGIAADPVAVADGFHDHIRLFDEVGHQNGAGLDSIADKSHADDRSGGRSFFRFSCHDSFSCN